jgi:S-DNA-T family DNA segregation ATPase FtsK/SpoIIIE
LFTGLVLQLSFYPSLPKGIRLPNFKFPKREKLKPKKKSSSEKVKPIEEEESTLAPPIFQESTAAFSLEDPLEETIENEVLQKEIVKEEVLDVIPKEKNSDAEEVAFEVAETPKSYDEEIKEKAKKLVDDFGEFDPTLELSQYKAPHLDLLEDHGSSNQQISVDKEELAANKDRIVETLSNYNIAIERITATVGPTVTLYEIVPQAGIRISKIKNLEDDIALSLSALGIRIIAPIPGKGTIGIEVPNKNPSVVSMRSVIGSKKFSSTNFDLPIAFGKTISNETFVVDLAKMPHMLMAGATGQGKSVGLNAVITSLLYKKHPAELKFVLVDPKKVELTLYNKIERHFLAKLPGSEEAIITDTKKVINTLNSLCIEMDDRYDLLKNAMVRNIKEYNAKFVKRKLNPNDGHRYLPYIVLVIDEFADLIMTAGKEVETPIARLAQLARAIGIHLIIATQRPSVNVITGIIKANFPARLAFRVTSKIDSRTILDGSGADQLIGRGDMLYTQGSEMVRLQCAFVDTPEVEEITSYIGSQRAYASAHLLPEYDDDSSESSLVDDISERDALFKEAAEIVVQSQQGSTSLIQRKMKIGYNRAGRIIDQLEAAGIVGPFEGSKARQVLFKDTLSLQQFFDNENQNT